MSARRTVARSRRSAPDGVRRTQRRRVATDPVNPARRSPQHGRGYAASRRGTQGAHPGFVPASGGRRRSVGAVAAHHGAGPGTRVAILPGGVGGIPVVIWEPRRMPVRPRSRRFAVTTRRRVATPQSGHRDGRRFRSRPTRDTGTNGVPRNALGAEAPDGTAHRSAISDDTRRYGPSARVHRWSRRDLPRSRLGEPPLEKGSDSVVPSFAGLLRPVQTEPVDTPLAAKPT